MKKTNEKPLFRVLFSIFCVFFAMVLLSSWLAMVTLSRYKSGIKAYTDITPASFHAQLIGGADAVQLMNAWENNEPVRLFGEQISLDHLQPGEVRGVPFSVANATGSGAVSGVDIEYTLTLRTTANIPLDFRVTRSAAVKSFTDSSGAALVPSAVSSGAGDTLETLYTEYCISGDQVIASSSLVNSSGAVISNSSAVVSGAVIATVPGTETFVIGPVRFTERDSMTDAPKYAYPLYRLVQTAFNGLQPEAEPYTFTLQGGELSVDTFFLEISWPIVPAADGKPASNDGIYMKEVDVIEMLADVVSADRRETQYVTSGGVYVPREHEFDAIPLASAAIRN